MNCLAPHFWRCRHALTPFSQRFFSSLSSFSTSSSSSLLSSYSSSSFRSSSFLSSSYSSSISSFPRSFSSLFSVSLNALADNPSAKQNKRRLGRGTGSGRGKTAGRGHKGSLSRNSRGLKPWFIGGQTPLYKLIPKRGFKSRRARLDKVNLNHIAESVSQCRIDPSTVITMKTLKEAGILTRKCSAGAKILAKGHRFHQNPLPPLKLEATDASSAAKLAVEKAGGEIKLVWHNRVTLRAHLKPEKFLTLPARAPLSPPRLRDKYERQLVGGEPSIKNKRDLLRQAAATQVAATVNEKEKK